MRKNIIRITDFNNPAVAVYNERSERNLLHFYEPEQGIFIAESPEVIERALAHGFEPVSFLIEKKQLTSIEAEASFAMKQSVSTETEDIINEKKTQTELGSGTVILKQMDSCPVYIAADYYGVEVCHGVSESRGDGSDSIVNSEKSSKQLMMQLHSMGFKTVALALSDMAISIEAPELSGIEKMAIVLGNEKNGISNAVLDECDYIVQIPMAPEVDSLNVAAASAVAFWQLRYK